MLLAVNAAGNAAGEAMAESNDRRLLNKLHAAVQHLVIAKQRLTLDLEKLEKFGVEET